VKNWNTIAARALKRIDSSYAIVLTGTPLENKLEETGFHRSVRRSAPVGPTLEAAARASGQGRSRASHRLYQAGEDRPNAGAGHDPPAEIQVLRQLPSRTDQNLLVPMTEPQMDYHQENADEVAKIVRRWRKTKFLSEMDQRRLMIALQNMRMSCNSTYLLDQETDHASRPTNSRHCSMVCSPIRGQGGGVFAMDTDPRYRHPPPRSARTGLRQLPRRRVVGENGRR